MSYFEECSFLIEPSDGALFKEYILFCRISCIEFYVHLLMFKMFVSFFEHHHQTCSDPCLLLSSSQLAACPIAVPGLLLLFLVNILLEGLGKSTHVSCPRAVDESDVTKLEYETGTIINLQQNPVLSNVHICIREKDGLNLA